MPTSKDYVPVVNLVEIKKIVLNGNFKKVQIYLGNKNDIHNYFCGKSRENILQIEGRKMLSNPLIEYILDLRTKTSDSFDYMDTYLTINIMHRSLRSYSE